MFEVIPEAQPRITILRTVSWSRTITFGHGNLTLGDAELQEVNRLHILWVTLDPKLTFETYLLEAKGIQESGCREPSRKIIPRMLKSCFNAYVLFSWSIVPPCGCRWRSFICVCWIVSFAG